MWVWAWSQLARQSGSLNMTGNVSHDGLSIRERGNTWRNWRHCQRTQTAKLESPDWTPVATGMVQCYPLITTTPDYYLTLTWPAPTRTDDMSHTFNYNLSGNKTAHLGLQHSWMRLTWLQFRLWLSSQQSEPRPNISQLSVLPKWNTTVE